MSSDTEKMKYVQTTNSLWWTVLLEGVVLGALGFLLLSLSNQTVLTVVRYIGVYWLIFGTLKIVSIFLDKQLWMWKLFVGTFGIITGVVIIQNPYWYSPDIQIIMLLVLGIMGLIGGISALIIASQKDGWNRNVPQTSNIVIGIILLINVWSITLLEMSFIADVQIFSWTFIGLLIRVLGAFALASSIVAIAIVFKMR